VEEENLHEEIRIGFHYARAISLFNYVYFFNVLTNERNERQNGIVKQTHGEPITLK